jgi:WhiB family redox-sensing transcriptional regulator
MTRLQHARAALYELAISYGNTEQRRHMVRPLILPGPWIKRAACRGLDAELFYPLKGLPVTEAKRVCARCPVKAPCLEFALRTNEKFGVWGGLSAIERRRMRRNAA